MDTTSDPDVRQDSVAELALKTWTFYFLVTALILGLLLFAAIRKATKICCWSCMYGSKYIRDQKEDPRVPATLFRAPSILTTLQDRYDKAKHKSSVRSKSDTTSYAAGYVTARDIELGDNEGDENTRVHRYLESMETPNKGLDDEILGSTSRISEGGDNGLSNYGSMPPSEADTSQKRLSGDSIELQEIEPEDDTIGRASTTSLSSSQNSTVSDDAPLVHVSMDPSGAGGSKRTRFKKNTAAPQATTSSRTASAKSSKRVSRFS